ncbi:MAG TPA: glycosyltransferase family 2 protein [Lacipirellulaceae bacterium]|nr:glycosyltransferase family 2 protein [Lacipirellulaceae bacterium]
MIDISIVIVNWNSTAYLLKCLESIYAHTHESKFEVIVVDNASPDGDVHTIKDRYPDVVVIESSANLGFAGANNLGSRVAQGRYLVFLNPDTVLVNSALDIMARQCDSLEEPGAVGCTLLNEDRSVQTSAIQTFPTILNQLLDIDILRNRFPACRLWNIAPLFASGTKPSCVEVISGACVMFRREVFAQIGQFSEEYFMYAEDLDLCKKAVQAGFTNYYVPQGQIIHYGGKSSISRQAVPMKWRAILRYMEKHRGYAYQLAFRIVMACSAMARLVLLTGLLAVCRGARRNSVRGALAKWWLILGTMGARKDRKQRTTIFTAQGVQGR